MCGGRSPFQRPPGLELIKYEDGYHVLARTIVFSTSPNALLAVECTPQLTSF